MENRFLSCGKKKFFTSKKLSSLLKRPLTICFSAHKIFIIAKTSRRRKMDEKCKNVQKQTLKLERTTQMREMPQTYVKTGGSNVTF